MLPNVQIVKQDGVTGVVRPSSDGNLVVIAASQIGTANQPSSFTRQDLAFTSFGYGPLVDMAGYDMAVANKPVVLIKGTTSTAAAAGTVVNTGAGTSTPTVTTATAFDDYDFLITFVAGGTLGTAGATYTYSLDGGKTTSGVQALGTALTIAVPNTGITVTLGTATQTVLAGQTMAFSTTGPRMTTADLALALEALRTYNGGWDSILVGSTYADSTVLGQLDLFLSTLEGTNGKFRTAVIGTTPRTAAQTEAQYATAMSTAYSATSTTRVVVCADQCYITSPTRAIRQRRSTALVVAARGMAIDIARDCAYVADGPLSTVQISDDRGNPLFHDEQLYPGLDDLRLATLRSFPALQGVYVNNPLLLSPSGSDYVFWQHARVMNKACELTVQALTNRLSQGVTKKPDGTIAEEDAKEIEGLVNDLLQSQIVKPRRASACLFVLSRTDDLTSNQGATLNGEIQLQALAYVKKFNVVSHFVKTIRTPA